MRKRKVRRIILSEEDSLGDYVKWPPDAPAVSVHQTKIAKPRTKDNAAWVERWQSRYRTVLGALGLKRQ
jgi:hypothetical protein